MESCKTCKHKNDTWYCSKNGYCTNYEEDYEEGQKITIGMLEDMEDSMIRATNKAELTRNQLLDTLLEKGVLAVYNLGMKHMYEYLEEK